MSERDVSRLGVDGKPPLPMHGQPQLPNSKSVPAALHHVGNNNNNGHTNSTNTTMMTMMGSATAAAAQQSQSAGSSSSMAAATAANAVAAAAVANANIAGKSRSIGNLTGTGGNSAAAAAAAAAAAGDQSFYQNLSVYRNQSHPNLGERYVLNTNTHECVEKRFSIGFKKDSFDLMPQLSKLNHFTDPKCYRHLSIRNSNNPRICSTCNNSSCRCKSLTVRCPPIIQTLEPLNSHKRPYRNRITFQHICNSNSTSINNIRTSYNSSSSSTCKHRPTIR